MKHFKIFSAVLFAVILAAVLGIGTSALEGVETIESHAWSIIVDEKPLDTSKLPFSAYEVGDDDVKDVMVPLRLVFEALGYTVGWNDATREITVEDGKRLMTLTNGCMTASFTGILESQYTCEMPLIFPVIIHDGHTFIPLSLVSCFDLAVKNESPNVWIKKLPPMPLITDELPPEAPPEIPEP